MKSKTNNFQYNQNLEQEEDDEIENFKTNPEYIKVIDNPNQNSLKEFISNLNKFNFSSAFDRKGAKSFLKSKGKALQEIDLNENILDENEFKVEENKKEAIKKKNASCKVFPKKIRKELKDMISYKQKVKSMKTINNFKNKLFDRKEKKKKSKSKHKKIKPRSNKDNTFYLKNCDNKEMNKDKKKLKKFNSEIELKMKSDKNLSKLKPIKKSCFNMKKNNFNLNNDNDNFCPFIRSDSSKTDSTLFHIVS